MAEPTEREAAVEEARQLITAGMVAELITDIRHMASAILAFGEHLDSTQAAVAELRSLRRRNGIIAGCALGLTLLLGAVVIVGGVLLAIGNSRLTDIATTNQRNGQQLVECTTPTPTSTTSSVPPHSCYEDSRAATGGAVRAIVDATVEAAICARTEATEEAIRECIRVRTATTTTEP